MNQESQNEPDVATVSETFCSEEEFALLLAERVRLLVYIDTLAQQNTRSRLSRKVYTTLAEQAVLVEDLLDDHDARYNKTFAGMLELVSSLGAFSAVGQSLRMIGLHTRASGFLAEKDLDHAFRQETERAQGFADRCVRVLLAEIHKEAARCCDLDTMDDIPLQILSQDGVRKRLPHTLGADDHGDVSAVVAAQASLFLAARKAMVDQAPCQRFDDVDSMRRFVSRICTEQRARILEVKLQNIKSRYDTFIANTPIELENQTLGDFRHALVMSLQLARVLRRLVHFYERHEDDLRTEVSKAAVPELVDKARVLDCILNYSLYYIYQYLDAGAPAAERLLAECSTTRNLELELPEGVILHARPASLIARVVNHHDMPVTITINGDSCYAGSIMQVILLAGRHASARTVSFSGDHTPIRDLQLLFEARLAEDGMDTLPEELDYLRSS